jgi:flagellar motor protein MotB
MINKQIKEDESNYFMSISDIMSGLMFIFILILAIFVVDFMIASKDFQDNINQLKENQEMRSEMLIDVQSQLAKLNVDIDIDIEHGVLRLNENAIRFTSGLAELTQEQQLRLQTVAKVLATILPCYGTNAPVNDICLPRTKGKLDSVFIEGHTDNVPIVGDLTKKFKNNWELSTARAIYTYQQITSSQVVLTEMTNTNNQPIISVSGYGDGRPVPNHEYSTPTNDPINRRIDIRFIMSPPSITEAEASLAGNIQ